MAGKAPYFAIVIIIALIDQLTKAWVLENLRGNEPIVLWRDASTGQIWFELYFTTNTGAAWGLFSGHTMYLAALSGVMILVIGWVLIQARAHERLLSVALALMLGGAFGNLLDRIMHGQVTDFLHVFLPIGGVFGWIADTFRWGYLQEQVATNMPGGIYDFPIFNIADSAVVIGTALLLLALMRPLPHPPEQPASAADEPPGSTDEPAASTQPATQSDVAAQVAGDAAEADTAQVPVSSHE